ncbi:hypothetical protein [Planococcus sp. CAU13]|uniref:hypothetical protein n=1 Tax=Planococcus sp. CAU13 TaxID=1541197 RepID=UPI00052FE173|nr:hypothetical protein [Planococcus sp. CAU13]
MHWMMWIFWGTLAAIFIISLIVDILTRGKYSLDKKERSLNQNLAEADALRHAGQNNHQSGMF